MNKFYLISLLNLGFICTLSAQNLPEKPAEKATELNEVSVVTVKKAIEQKADRTIFNVADQPNLNSGSVLEGLKKLPGLIASDIAGMMYQGKQLDVYLDGRPLNISTTELNAFLEGMPANSIERIEIITQPGAEFPATSGGAILNIVTSKNAKNYLSATYTNSTSFTSYEDMRWRVNNSILLNAKNKYFGWQLNLGQNYRESAIWTTLESKSNNNSTLLSSTDADRVGRNNYIKSVLTFDIGKDRLLFNYDVTQNSNDSYTLGNGLGFSTNDASKTRGVRQDALATYQRKFDDSAKKLDFRFNYNNNDNQFELNPVGSTTSTLDNSSNQNLYNFKVDYSQPIAFSDNGKISIGGLYDELLFEASSKGVKNLDYDRRTVSSYIELQSEFDKLKFIVGTRAEDYNITGKTNTANLTAFKQFQIFPNASAQYNFNKMIFFNLNYNRKITLPSTSALNPNNTNYQNPTIEYSGNPNLQPTIFNNYEVKFSAYDYIYLSYNISEAKNQVITRVTLDNNRVLNSNENIPEIKIHNFSMGLPIPYMLFSKGLAETRKMNVNPDTMNFLYVFSGYQYHQIPNLNTKGFWYSTLMSQVVLPEKIKFIANFSYIFPRGNYFYFLLEKPFKNSLDLSFSKKFYNNQLTLSVYADDVLNTNRNAVISVGTPLLISNRMDSRKFGFSLSYKIPTKNSLAKEAPNLLDPLQKDSKEVIAPQLP